jgi:TRAP-type uncharacterized transport system substrate-binding protein
MRLTKIILIAGALLAGSIGSAMAGELRLCSGVDGRNYDYTAEKLAQQMRGEVDVININTAGSWENLVKLDKGECDAIIVQSDNLYTYTKEVRPLSYFDVSHLYTEYSVLLCNRDSAVKQFSDLTAGSKVYSGAKGSGSNVSIRGLIKADAEFGSDAYKDIGLPNELDDKVALVKTKAKAADCLFNVGSKGNEFLSVHAEKLSKNLVIVPIVDKDFNDVTLTDANGVEMSVWEPREMPSDTYGDIMPGGIFGNDSVDTISVTAMLIVSDKYVSSNPTEFSALGLGVDEAIDLVRADRGLTLED